MSKLSAILTTMAIALSTAAITCSFVVKGPTGDKGPKGDPGLKGDQGDPGKNGTKGETGGRGEVGDKGQNGADAILPKKEIYTVTFDVEGDTNLIPSIEVEDGKLITTIPENPTKVGYKFVEWTCNDEEFVFDKCVITADTTLKATFTNTIWISFITHSDETINPIKAYMNSKHYSLPEPTLPGSVFQGWMLNGVLISDHIDVLEEDIVLEASYL